MSGSVIRFSLSWVAPISSRTCCLPNREAVFDFLAGTLPRIPGIAHADALLGLDTVKFLFHFARIPIRPQRIVLPDPVVELGEIDWPILDALVMNGRASNREIARSLGVSDGTVRTRFRRLEAAGLIRICARIRPSKSGMITERAFVALSVRGRDARAVARELAAMPEALTVSLVSGAYDIVAYVVASSRARIVEIIARQLRGIAGVHATKSYDIIDVAKSHGYWARW